MTTDFSPDTAEALAIGATHGGFVGSDVYYGWPVRNFNQRVVEYRHALMAVADRDRQRAWRREIRGYLGEAMATIKIMAVGDSMAAGYGSQAGGWEDWLVDLLDQQRIDVTMSRLAIVGKTMREIDPLLPDALATNQPDVTILQLGTGDAVKSDLTDWQARYAVNVDRVLNSAPTARVVCAKPAMSSDSGYQAGERAIAGYIDAVVTSRQATARVIGVDLASVVNDTWTVDGIHYTEAAHLRVAMLLASALASTNWLPAAP